MIILDKQIISPILIQSVIENEIPIFYNGDKRELRLPLKTKLLTNSESCLAWLETSNFNHPHVAASRVVKNKAMFRSLITPLAKDYFYQLVKLNELNEMNADHLPFPIVIKPNKGYSSVGVYVVHEQKDWEKAVQSLQAELLLTQGVYHHSLVNSEEIIIEQYIDGQEYAVDCYINHEGKPVVLNILKRMFVNKEDTSDRIYYTSNAILKEIKDEILQFLYTLNEVFQVKNYPFHLEVRKSEKGIIPIELNPLRFAGAGTTDISHYAFDIRGDESYFLDHEPDWDMIVKKEDPFIYSFFCAEIPEGMRRESVKTIDHEKLKNEFHHLIEYREIKSSSDRLFAIIFFKVKSLDQLTRLLNLDLRRFIEAHPLKEEIK
ncbi:ATP-grasp domain-containing protein [Jeotgalibacillus sp. R-1-5s-1]|uniref:ATP-grasp domain-containing protein n=1 Tax=Jeotgalibacillus sp. R-1-5s-1 TaxID=2555897 RepID=UPI0010699AAE|nr:ATP-grasp domain-containing protein [Jeotgalibacillus sp. R-1-5s-1]TFD96261.1 ATP-grasp domain-containing protein [Jeotgalibacillus sp. R-1-5s-1]